MVGVVDNLCGSSPLLGRIYLEGPLDFLCWAYLYLAGPFLGSLCWSKRGKEIVCLIGEWLEGSCLAQSPQEGCGGIWGCMQGGDRNLCRGSPLAGRSCHEGPLFFLH